MAFSKAPSQDTYQTKEVKLIWSMSNRDNSLSKDPIVQNGFFEITQDKGTRDEDYSVIKRNGAKAYPYTIPSTNIRGMYYWEDEDKLFVAYDNKIALITGSTGVLETTLTPFLTTTGEVAFTEFYYDTGSTKVVVADGSRLWTVDTANTAVQCVDADLPTPFIPSLLFLDGYLFLIKQGTADIYNSSLNDPLAWTPGDFISAEMLPDTVVRLSRLNNYMVVFGTASVEYFFDAGNASGSPMQRNDTPVKQIGYLGGYAAFGNKVFFVGQLSMTTPVLYVLEDFKVEEITIAPLRRFLQPTSSFFAAVVSNNGHDFYILTTDGVTLVLDLETKIWYTWKFGTTNNFPITNAVQIKTSDGHVSVFSQNNTASLYSFAPDEYQDGGVSFTFSGITKKENYNTARRKFMARLVVLADQVNGNLSIQISDDDYQTYSTARTVSLSTEKPSIYQLGSFVNRSFKYEFTENLPLRLFGFEVDYKMGIR